MDRKVTFKGDPVTLTGFEVKVGDLAKDFTALDNELNQIKLKDFKGKVVVLSSMPSIDTSICALQAIRFNREAAVFGDKVQILSLSVDLPFALTRFCAARGIKNAKTLSDHKELDFGNKYGLVIKELRLLGRGVFVIDKNGIVQYVEYLQEISELPNYDAALEAIKKLL